MIHHQPFDLLDLRIRVPPQLAQRLTVTPSPPPPPPPPDPTAVVVVVDTPKAWLVVRRFMPLMACALSLSPLFFAREEYSACAYLLLAPLTVPILIGFNLSHRNRQWLSCTLAFLSIVLGNLAAVLYCSSLSFFGYGGVLRLWLVSAAMGTSAVQLLLLISKSNVILVMISTASAVIVCCLVLIAPMLPSLTMAYRCYQSTSVGLVWLMVHAITTANHADHDTQCQDGGWV